MDTDKVDPKRPFLCVLDLRNSGLWVVIFAESPKEILRRFPILEVFPEGKGPKWMDEQTLRRHVERDSVDLESIPLDHWLNTALREGYPSTSRSSFDD